MPGLKPAFAEERAQGKWRQRSLRFPNIDSPIRPSNPISAAVPASGGSVPGRNSEPAVEPSASATSTRWAKSDGGEVGPGVATAAGTSASVALRAGPT